LAAGRVRDLRPRAKMRRAPLDRAYTSIRGD
jgi:hypothetical protein